MARMSNEESAVVQDLISTVDRLSAQVADIQERLDVLEGHYHPTFNGGGSFTDHSWITPVTEDAQGRPLIAGERW